MKNLFLFFSIFIVSQSFGQWNQVTGDSLNGISNLEFFKLRFLDENIGYSAALNRAPNPDVSIYYKTTDGGVTWNRIMGLNGGQDFIFLNESKGFILGEFLYITENSGNLWYQISSVTNGKKIEFLNDTVGYIVSNSEMFKTVDGGITWVKLLNFSGNYSTDMFFLNKEVGWVINSSSIFKTMDGGKTWKEHNLPLSLQGYGSTGLHFTDSLNGHAIGQEQFENGHAMDVHAQIIKTIDGGKTWNRTYFMSHGILSDLTFTSTDTGYAVGGGYVTTAMLLRTTDGGDNWHPQDNFPRIGMTTIEFVNNSVGFIAGEGIMKTINGGGDMTEVIAKPEPTYDIILFPNPTLETLYIRINNTTSSSPSRYEYEIMDNSGRTILTGGNVNFQEFITVNVNSLKNGIYHIRVRDPYSNFNSTGSFIMNKMAD